MFRASNTDWFYSAPPPPKKKDLEYPGELRYLKNDSRHWDLETKSLCYPLETRSCDWQSFI